MAIHGKKTRIWINAFDTANLFKSSRLPLAKQDVDDTGFGQDDNTGVPGLRSAAYNLEGFFRIGSDGITMRADCENVVKDIGDSSHEDESALIVHGPEGLAIGDEVLMMLANQSAMELSAAINNIVMLSAVYNVSGGVTIGTVLVSPYAP